MSSNRCGTKSRRPSATRRSSSLALIRWAEGEWMDNWKADADEAGVNVVDSVICYDAPDDEGEAACRALGAELA